MFKKIGATGFQKVLDALPSKVRMRLESDMEVYGNAYLEFNIKNVDPRKMMKKEENPEPLDMSILDKPPQVRTVSVAEE